MQLPIPVIKGLNSMLKQRTLLQLLDKNSPASIVIDQGSKADTKYDDFIRNLVNTDGCEKQNLEVHDNHLVLPCDDF